MPGSHHGHHNKMKYYIVLATLVVGAIFIVLMVNNDGEGFSLTNAIISSNTTTKIMEKTNDKITGGSVTDIPANKKKVDMALSFNELPDFKHDVEINEMELNFADLTTTITVNKDKLELNNLKEVILKIEGFEGEIDFQNPSVSALGVATRISVNGVALSASKNLDLAFDGLDYNYLRIDDLKLKSLILGRGSGNLTVGEGLSYDINNDRIYLDNYAGEFIADKNADAPLTLNGITQGLSVRGDSFNFKLE